LATSLGGELGELVGIFPGLSLRLDIRQLPVDFAAESDELSNERLLLRDLLGRGRATTPRDPDKYDDERREQGTTSIHVVPSRSGPVVPLTTGECLQDKWSLSKDEDSLQVSLIRAASQHPIQLSTDAAFTGVRV